MPDPAIFWTTTAAGPPPFAASAASAALAAALVSAILRKTPPDIRLVGDVWCVHLDGYGISDPLGAGNCTLHCGRATP